MRRIIGSHWSIPGEKSSCVLWIVQPHLVGEENWIKTIRTFKKVVFGDDYNEGGVFVVISPVSLQGFPFCRLGQAPSVKGDL